MNLNMKISQSDFNRLALKVHEREERTIQRKYYKELFLDLVDCYWPELEGKPITAELLDRYNERIRALISQWHEAQSPIFKKLYPIEDFVWHIVWNDTVTAVLPSGLKGLGNGSLNYKFFLPNLPELYRLVEEEYNHEQVIKVTELIRLAADQPSTQETEDRKHQTPPVKESLTDRLEELTGRYRNIAAQLTSRRDGWKRTIGDAEAALAAMREKSAMELSSLGDEMHRLATEIEELTMAVEIMLDHYYPHPRVSEPSDIFASLSRIIDITRKAHRVTGVFHGDRLADVLGSHVRFHLPHIKNDRRLGGVFAEGCQYLVDNGWDVDPENESPAFWFTPTPGVGRW